MIEASVTETVNNFHWFLERVQRGETLRIRKHGRPVARLVSDVGFMSAAEFSAVFDGYQATTADAEAADAILENIRRMDAETTDALAH